MELGMNERGEKVVELIGDIPVSAEGKARARKKLAAAAKRMPPERFAQLRKELGLPPQSIAPRFTVRAESADSVVEALKDHLPAEMLAEVAAKLSQP